MILPGLILSAFCIVEKFWQFKSIDMIPDYLRFIRFQDRMILLFIYLITLILLGFYWKNTDFTFTRDDAWVVSAIFALVLHNFIFDLKAYWAYKCVVKNIDLSFFKDKTNKKIEIVMFKPLVAVTISLFIFGAFSSTLFLLTTPGIVLILLAMFVPLMIWGMFAIIRNGYVKQVAISFVDKVRWKSLTRYMLPTMFIGIIMNLLVIGPLRHSEQFDFNGAYFTLEAIITMCVLCTIVFVLSLLSKKKTKRYVFLGHLFLNEIDFTFSKTLPWRSLYDKPHWLQLVILLIVEAIWVTVVALLFAFAEWQVWFEIYYLLCYLPFFSYYIMRCYWKWHNDFIMSCDMYIRWGEISKQTRLW